MNKKICETQITGEYLAKYFKEFIGSHAILHSVDGEKFGQGQQSCVLRLKLTWEPSEKDGLPESVIVKIPGLQTMSKDTDKRKLLESMGIKLWQVWKFFKLFQLGKTLKKMVVILHNNECDFYQLVGNSLPCEIPKCFAAVHVINETPAGMIVLEDKSKEAAAISSIFDGLNYNQSLAVFSAMAHLHAWSLTTTIDWRSKFPSMRDREEYFNMIMQMGPDGCKVAKKSFPEHFGSINLDKIEKLFTLEMFMQLATEHQEFMEDVLIHGDAYALNVLFEKNESGNGITDRLVALIDFQLVTKSSPAYDLGRLFYTSITAEVRKNHYDDILHHYYDEVKKLAGDKYKLKYDQLRYLVDRQFAFGSILTVAVLSMMTETMLKSEGDQRKIDKKKIVENCKMNYDDAVKILDLY